jgi:hypothetical protein
MKDLNAWLFPSPKDQTKPETSDAHEAQLTRLIEKCGLKTKLDESSKRYAVHPHCLRKTFYSKCLANGVLPNLANAWLGHTVGLDQNYLRLGDETLISEWRKVESSLVFLSPITDVKTMKDTSDRIKQLESENARLTEETAELRNWQEDQGERIDELLKRSVVVEKTSVPDQRRRAKK